MGSACSGSDDEPSGWYCCKGTDQLLGLPVGTAEQLKTGDFEPAGRPLLCLRNRWKAKRQLSHRQGHAVGRLTVTALAGSRLPSVRPYLILALDGNEHRTSTARSSSPHWPDSSCSFPILDASSDLCVFLFDDRAIRNETCIGRVIVPLSLLCRPGLRLQPKPKHASWFIVQPAQTQHAQDGADDRYHEAVPGIPGSGMVRPARPLGCVRLELQLEWLSKGHSQLGALSAFAEGHTAPAVFAGLEPPDGFDPKVVRRNINRLKRQVGLPYLVRFAPSCALILPLHLAGCLWMEAYHLPLALWMVGVANGLLGWLHREEREAQIIYWEDSVGPNQIW